MSEDNVQKLMKNMEKELKSLKKDLEKYKPVPNTEDRFKPIMQISFTYTWLFTRLGT